jgi:hypothetical protein
MRLHSSWYALLAAVVACADPSPPVVSDRPDAGFPDAGTAAPMDASFDARVLFPEAGAPVDAAPPCENLACQQRACGDGGSTTLTGRVFAPNGTLPLYNVIVYVPNAELAPLATELSCSQCGVGVSGKPVVSALSDATGAFVLHDVPVGDDIPLVFQVGKWRRKVTVPRVEACRENRLSDPELTRLPRSREEGDLPRIAVTTGDCDPLACLLPKLGIAPEEFGLPRERRAVSLYGASAQLLDPTSPWASMPPSDVLWNHPRELAQYDLAMFSCECMESYGPTRIPGELGVSKDDASMKVVADYLARGGRVFTTDLQYTWYKFSSDPALRATAAWPGGAFGAPSPTVTLDTSFPKGKALSDWLASVYPAAPRGEVTLNVVFENIGPIDDRRVRSWASSLSNDGGSVPRFVTINTPVDAEPEAQCGKAVHLDAHIVTDTVSASFPEGCTSELSPGEAAFAYFFFDLASCIQTDSEPPKPPAVPDPVLR